MKSVSYENKIKSAIRGAQSVPMAMLTICGKTYPSNNKYVIFKNSTILMMSVSENFLLESGCF
jgi:hypothetical protein